MQRELAIHLVRTALSLAGFVAAAACGEPLLAAVCAAAAWFAAFTWAHDLFHGRLGLSRRGRDVVLAIVGQLLLQSGHALRLLHLRHHARPGAPDDVEGRAINEPFLRTLASLPGLLVTVRLLAFRAGTRAHRRWQLAEGALNAVTTATLLAFPIVRTYAIVALFLQATAPIWGGLIPHRPPPWLLRAAEALVFTRSVIVASLAFHLQHHAAPHIASARLGDHARHLRGR